ncbi:MAG: hypothetical protein KC503_37555 [Myxococcales bacterium]|nr:hypothetical protein [Myxococcales bacterium]
MRTRKLWRAAEGKLLTAFPAFSVDETVAIRDWLWFPEQGASVSIAAYLRALARRLFVASGSVASPRAPDLQDESMEAVRHSDVPGARSRRFLRWLSFALPPHLLLAVHPDKPLHVDVLTPSLDRMLADHGFAEPHLHVGAGLRFEDLWVSALVSVSEARHAGFSSPGAELDHGDDLLPWMLRIAVVRQWLAVFLADGGRTTFHWWLLHVGLAGLPPTQSLVARREVWSAVARGQLGAGARSSAVHAALQGLLREFCPINASRPDAPQCYAELHSHDPIARWFGGGRLETPDRLLIVCAMRHVEQHPNDLAFQALFYQLIRVQGLFYRHLVQRPMTPGLLWFIRFYSRMSPAKKLVSSMKVKVEAAAAVCGRSRGLRSLEVRTAPDDTDHMRRDFAGLFEAARGLNGADETSAGLEVGLVLHLTKSRGVDADRGQPNAHGRGCHADPEPYGTTNGFGYRFGSYYDSRRSQIMALADLLESHPHLLRLVRGIDACTDELGTPNWVLAPLFRYFIRVSEAVGELLAVRDPYVRSRPPRCRRTIHVGEDFIHLQGGLRRIDEAIQFLPLEHGDRLGHGLALGVDPAKWSIQSGRLALTREERLLDLTWEWRLNSIGRVATGRDLLLEREIRRMAKQVFQRELSPWAVDCLVRDLHDDAMLRRAGFPGDQPPGQGDSGGSSAPMRERSWILGQYLTNKQVYRRGQAIEWVDAEGDGAALSILSRYLRERVARLGLIVEVNPTSNLLIGHLGQLRDHPLWRLQPPTPAADLVPVRICIGSDDPLTFATNLPNEYQLISDAMQALGYTASQCGDWLESVRKAGMDGRFTLPWREQPSVWQYSSGFIRFVSLPP